MPDHHNNPGHADWTNRPIDGPCHEIAAVLAEAGVGFVGEAERHKDVLFERGEKWKDRTERAEELFRDASVRLDEQRKMTDEAEARADRAEAEAHNLGHDLDRAEARLWRLAAKAGHVPGESDNNATAELVVTEALDALADLRTRVRALADEWERTHGATEAYCADRLRALLDDGSAT